MRLGDMTPEMVEEAKGCETTEERLAPPKYAFGSIVLDGCPSLRGTNPSGPLALANVQHTQATDAHPRTRGKDPSHTHIPARRAGAAHQQKVLPFQEEPRLFLPRIP